MLGTLRAILLAGFVLSAVPSFGFVETLTHGYLNCMACHISPSGGGLLTDYGRSLSKELMSAWSWKSSEHPLFGLARNTKQLKIGGDYRAVQTYFENSQIKQGKQFVMQRNIELGLNYAKIWIVGTAGVQDGPAGTPMRGDFLSERHYLIWELTDELRLRLGKFRLNFGLNDPNHTRVTKQPLGFGSNSESYVLEISKFSEADEIFVSADLGRIDIPREKSKERSISAGYSKYFFENSKLGANILLGESEEKRRGLFNLNGIIATNKKMVLKFETSYEESHLSAFPTDQKELTATTLSFGYQAIQGFFPYFFGEHLQTGLNDSRTRQSAVGMGLQFLPLPHIEFQIEYKKGVNRSLPVGQSDSGWFLFHIYL